MQRLNGIVRGELKDLRFCGISKLIGDGGVFLIETGRFQSEFRFRIGSLLAAAQETEQKPGNTHDFNDKIHVKPIDKKYTCNNRYLFVPI